MISKHPLPSPMGKGLFPGFLILWVFLAGCEGTDVSLAIQAGTEAYQAATLDDKDVERLALEISNQSDLNHTVAPPDNDYARRLQELVGGNNGTQGRGFNFKVYLSPKVNAFAMADGTIRIYSGLMDMLDDGELLFVVGHEMGHIVEKHIKKQIMLGYAGSAVRKAIASQKNEGGEIARSAIGALAENLLSAQFSQQEELEADNFGVLFLKQRGRDDQPAISALMKLAALGKEHSFLSSHPAPEARARRLRENESAPPHSEKPPMAGRILDWLKGLWLFKGSPGGQTSKS